MLIHTKALIWKCLHFLTRNDKKEREKDGSRDSTHTGLLCPKKIQHFLSVPEQSQSFFAMLKSWWQCSPTELISFASGYSWRPEFDLWPLHSQWSQQTLCQSNTKRFLVTLSHNSLKGRPVSIRWTGLIHLSAEQSLTSTALSLIDAVNAYRVGLMKAWHWPAWSRAWHGQGSCWNAQQEWHHSEERACVKGKT